LIIHILAFFDIRDSRVRLNTIINNIFNPNFFEFLDTAGKGKAFIEAIRTLNRNMNIPEKFDFIKEEDLPILIERALKEGNPLYPVPKIMDKKDCEAVIRSFMA